MKPESAHTRLLEINTLPRGVKSNLNQNSEYTVNCSCPGNAEEFAVDLSMPSEPVCSVTLAKRNIQM